MHYTSGNRQTLCGRGLNSAPTGATNMWEQVTCGECLTRRPPVGVIGDRVKVSR